ncbi:antitoxin MazE-like protein [Vulcanococcus limneticus]|uniref:antitoxin MazE-like protein n=1 Tax=Vulcanococcus limneticus TaxID=2170428 RepID=UPI00398C158B
MRAQGMRPIQIWVPGGIQACTQAAGLHGEGGDRRSGGPLEEMRASSAALDDYRPNSAAAKGRGATVAGQGDGVAGRDRRGGSRFLFRGTPAGIDHHAAVQGAGFVEFLLLSAQLNK